MALPTRSPVRQRKAVAALLAGYFAALLYASRAIGVEMDDGLLAIQCALRVLGLAARTVPFAATRPPADWLLLTPVAGLSYWLSGPRFCLAASHAFMCAMPPLIAWVSYRLYARLLPAWLAALMAAALALNPLMIRYAPFVLFDIFGALPVLVFAAASWSFIQNPRSRSAVALAAAYAFAVWSRYQFFVLILIPLAHHYAARARGRGRPMAARWQALLWALPALAYGATVLLLAAALARVGEPGGPVGRAHEALLRQVIMGNLRKATAPPWHAYFPSLWADLGPAIFLLMVVGLYDGASEPGTEAAHLAFSFLAPFAVLTWVIAAKEERYLLSLLPLAYAAAGRGLLRLGAGKPRWAAAAGGALVLALLPWSRGAASWRYLAEEESLHTQLPWRLADAVLARSGPDAHVCWGRGDLYLPARNPPQGLAAQLPALGNNVMDFFLARRAGAYPWEEDSRCDYSARLEPAGRDEDSAVLARVFFGGGMGRGAPAWELSLEGVRPLPGPK